MEQKTTINAAEGKQDIWITREFDAPVELLFKAHADPQILVRWMSNPYSTAKALKFEGKRYGSYQLESTDATGKVVFRSNGVIHEFIENEKIIRTFEMEYAPFGVQFEIYDFERLTENTSKLTMHVIYESGLLRDQLLKMPFAQGINMAHNQLEEVIKNLK